MSRLAILLLLVLADAPSHPLDPLNRSEILLAAQVLRDTGKTTERSRIAALILHEPPKEDVLRFKPGSAFRREAFAIIYERETNHTFEAVVDLRAKRVVTWKQVPGAQAGMMIDDFNLTRDIVRADKRWQEALRRRGITDFENVEVDGWAAGHYGLPEEDGSRQVRAVSYYRGAARNQYARPLEGVIAYVDLNKKRVIKLEDSGPLPIPAAADLDATSLGKTRPAPTPLRITQPDGPSFTGDGHEIRWQNWRFRFAVLPREALVLYTVGYEDQGKLRSILHRAALSELFVPYGQPGPAWYFRNAFDAGEYTLFVGPQEPGTDVPEHARFFTAYRADNYGGVMETPRAVALYERDGGLLWKHNEWQANYSRRARQLVLSSIFTNGNYDYGLNWVFHQDGTLEVEVLLTGIMLARGVAAQGKALGHGAAEHGHRVGEHVEAVHHQHFFNFRLDFDLDTQVARGNSVVELNTEALPPGPQNRFGGAFVMKETVLRTEKEAQRSLNLATNRKWKVINSSVKNAFGQPTGYLLFPEENSVPYLHPESPARKRAGFLDAHLWVTRHDAAERYATGDYVHQSKGGDGLPRYVRANRPIENEDVVLWYTLGVTHIPRPEEWPVMPVHRAGFKLLPSGFFARNPALDVPK